MPEPIQHDLPAAANDAGVFRVHLDNFEGPFDLLLQLISRHKMDVTEVSLSRVTDEFIGHIKAAGSDWDLEQTSQFIVVAATLLDLKAARLIPSGEVDDPEDLALLEARDLLFARLLQYRAFKQVAAYLSESLARQGRRFPRSVALEARFARLVPELTFTISPERFAALAAKALAPKQADVVSLTHLHAATVNVGDQAAVVVDRLRRSHTITFRALTGDSPDLITTVCRFLALLELFKEGAVAFEQLTPLGELTIRWTGSDAGELTISDEFDALSGVRAELVEAPGSGGVCAELVEAPGSGGVCAELVEAPGSGGVRAELVEVPGSGGVRAELVEVPGSEGVRAELVEAQEAPGPSTGSGHIESTGSGHIDEETV